MSLKEAFRSVIKDLGPWFCVLGVIAFILFVVWGGMVASNMYWPAGH